MDIPNNLFGIYWLRPMGFQWLSIFFRPVLSFDDGATIRHRIFHPQSPPLDFERAACISRMEDKFSLDKIGDNIVLALCFLSIPLIQYQMARHYDPKNFEN